MCPIVSTVAIVLARVRRNSRRASTRSSYVALYTRLKATVSFASFGAQPRCRFCDNEERETRMRDVTRTLNGSLNGFLKVSSYNWSIVKWRDNPHRVYNLSLSKKKKMNNQTQHKMNTKIWTKIYNFFLPHAITINNIRVIAQFFRSTGSYLFGRNLSIRIGALRVYCV